jgi:hypothetical protein
VFLEPVVRVRGNLIENLEALGRDEEAFDLTSSTLELARALGPGPLLVLVLRKHADLAERLGQAELAFESSIEALRAITPSWQVTRERLNELVRHLALEVLERADRRGDAPEDVVDLLGEILG